MRDFILVFDRLRGAIIEREEHGVTEREVAWAASDRLTEKHVREPNVEVVLLGANSEAELRATHGRSLEPLTIA